MASEEDIRRIAQEEFDKLSYNYYRRNYPNFNITSGHNSEGHGKSEFMMATDSGQSIEFFKQGNAKIVSRNSLDYAEHGIDWLVGYNKADGSCYFYKLENYSKIPTKSFSVKKNPPDDFPTNIKTKDRK